MAERRFGQDHDDVTETEPAETGFDTIDAEIVAVIRFLKLRKRKLKLKIKSLR